MRECEDHSDQRVWGTIAAVAGAARRFCSQAASGDQSVSLQDATAHLHTITKDPHLLAHGIVEPTDHLFAGTERLLLAAGADPAVLAELAQEKQRRMNAGRGRSDTAPAGAR